MKPLHKKLLIGGFILVFVMGITIPFISNAWCLSLSCIYVPIITSMIMGVVNAIQGLLAQLAWVFAELIHWMINWGSTLMTLPVVQAGFKVSLSLVNLMMVIGLIVSAFQIILGVDDHGAKSRLKNVIIAALFINFSFLIAGFLLDVSNVFTNFFLQHVNGAGIADAFSLSKLANMIEPNGNITTWAGLFAMLPLALFSIAITLVALIIMLAVFITALVRNVYVAVLLTVMPLAWGCWIFPGLSEYNSKWWKNFLKQGVMVLPTISFFLYLTVATGKAMHGATSSLPSNMGAWGSTGPSFIDILMNVGMQMFILGAFLIGGLKISQEAGAAGAAMGETMVKGLAKGVYQGTGAQSYVRGLATKASNKIGNVANRPGVLGAIVRNIGGREAANALAGVGHQDHDIEEAQKRLFGNMGYEQLRDTVATTDVEKAAKLKALSAMGKLDKYLEDQKDGKTPSQPGQTLVDMAEAYKHATHKDGKDLKEIKELVTVRPDLAADLYGIDKKTLSDNGGDTVKARAAIIAKAVSKLSASDAAKIDPDALNDEVMNAIVASGAESAVRGIMRDGSTKLRAEFLSKLESVKGRVVAAGATATSNTPARTEELVSMRIKLEEEVRAARDAVEAADPANKPAAKLALKAKLDQRKSIKDELLRIRQLDTPTSPNPAARDVVNLSKIIEIKDQVINGRTDI